MSQKVFCAPHPLNPLGPSCCCCWLKNAVVPKVVWGAAPENPSCPICIAENGVIAPLAASGICPGAAIGAKGFCARPGGAGPIANGVGGKDSAGVDVCDVTYGRGGVCSRAPVGSPMTGCTEDVEVVDVVIDMDMGDDEKGFVLVEKAVPFVLAGSGAWLNGFVALRWSAGLDRGAEVAKGSCAPDVNIEIGLATRGVVASAWPRDNFVNGFEALLSLVGCC